MNFFLNLIIVCVLINGVFQNPSLETNLDKYELSNHLCFNKHYQLKELSEKLCSQYYMAAAQTKIKELEQQIKDQKKQISKISEQKKDCYEKLENYAKSYVNKNVEEVRKDYEIRIEAQKQKYEKQLQDQKNLFLQRIEIIKKEDAEKCKGLVNTEKVAIFKKYEEKMYELKELIKQLQEQLKKKEILGKTENIHRILKEMSINLVNDGKEVHEPVNTQKPINDPSKKKNQTPAKPPKIEEENQQNDPQEGEEEENHEDKPQQTEIEKLQAELKASKQQIKKLQDEKIQYLTENNHLKHNTVDSYFNKFKQYKLLQKKVKSYEENCILFKSINNQCEAYQSDIFFSK